MKPWSLAFALALWMPAALPAACIDVRALAGFVTARTGLAGLPGCLDVARTAFARNPRLMLSQAGAYDPATDRIALAPDLDLTTALGRSYLVHELVHMAQFRNAAPARCAAEREAQAYGVQIAYLRDQGESREALLLALATGALTSCTPLPAEY